MSTFLDVLMCWSGSNNDIMQIGWESILIWVARCHAQLHTEGFKGTHKFSLDMLKNTWRGQNISPCRSSDSPRHSCFHGALFPFSLSLQVLPMWFQDFTCFHQEAKQNLKGQSHYVPVYSVRYPWQCSAAMDQESLKPGWYSVEVWVFEQRSQAHRSCSMLCRGGCVGSGPSLPFSPSLLQMHKTAGGRPSMWGGFFVEFPSCLAWGQKKSRFGIGFCTIPVQVYSMCLHLDLLHWLLWMW